LKNNYLAFTALMQRNFFNNMLQNNLQGKLQAFFKQLLTFSPFFSGFSDKSYI